MRIKKLCSTIYIGPMDTRAIAGVVNRMTGETFKYYTVELEDGTIKMMTKEEFEVYLEEFSRSEDQY